ncbi:hypothetical protein [Streptomyces sp. NPDC008240]|uniref:hypothetical protein n=1 Tax=Streptomyces sp. NPDC008240 TaxID=3364822 RepID=UPI0036EC2D2D
MTEHSVNEVGQPLFHRGGARSDWAGGDRIEASGDAAAADPARWHSDAGPEALRALRTLLSGY